MLMPWALPLVASRLPFLVFRHLCSCCMLPQKFINRRLLGIQHPTQTETNWSCFHQRIKFEWDSFCSWLKGSTKIGRRKRPKNVAKYSELWHQDLRYFTIRLLDSKLLESLQSSFPSRDSRGCVFCVRSWQLQESCARVWKDGPFSDSSQLWILKSNQNHVCTQKQTALDLEVQRANRSSELGDASKIVSETSWKGFNYECNVDGTLGLPGPFKTWLICMGPSRTHRNQIHFVFLSTFPLSLFHLHPFLS